MFRDPKYLRVGITLDMGRKLPQYKEGTRTVRGSMSSLELGLQLVSAVDEGATKKAQLPCLENRCRVH